MNPRQIEAQMKRMGINMTELEDVEEVIIRMKTKDLVLKKPSVTFISAQGQKSYQVVGEAKEVPKTPPIPKGDIQMVAQAANVSEEEAERALEECGGQPAGYVIEHGCNHAI